MIDVKAKDGMVVIFDTDTGRDLLPLSVSEGIDADEVAAFMSNIFKETMKEAKNGNNEEGND